MRASAGGLPHILILERCSSPAWSRTCTSIVMRSNVRPSLPTVCFEGAAASRPMRAYMLLPAGSPTMTLRVSLDISTYSPAEGTPLPCSLMGMIMASRMAPAEESWRVLTSYRLPGSMGETLSEKKK